MGAENSMGDKVTSYKVLFRFSVSEKKPLSELMYWVGVVVGDNILPKLSRASSRYCRGVWSWRIANSFVFHLSA
jgi:predicted metalloprotease